MNSVPAVRFAGFTDPWEQRKFSDVFSFMRNNTLSRAELSETEGSVYDIHYGDVLIKYGAVLDADADYLPRITDDLLAASLSCQHLEDGDVIIADTAEDETVGRCTELRGCGNKAIVSGLHTMACRPQFEFARGYLGYYLNSSSFHDQLLPLMQGIKVISVSKSAIGDTSVSFPSMEEQKRIGCTLMRLDDLITLHQRKLDSLTTLKKALLDKMFPRDGAVVPEIRFAGFTDPWEQRKLGELFVESDERSSELEILSVSVANGIYPASESDRTTNPGASLASYKVVHRGDIVYNSMRMWQGAVDSSLYYGIVSPAYVVARPSAGAESRFFARFLKRSEMLHQYQRYSQGNSKDTQVLQFKEFADIEVAIPLDSQEQVQIGASFDCLDDLITLHQRKFELLKNLKAACLDKMFV